MNQQDHPAAGGWSDRGHAPTSPVNGLVGARLGRRVRDLLVEVRPTGLVLRGRADSYHVKQLAQHAATGVTGLPVLANRIEVVTRRGELSPAVTGEFGGEAGVRPRPRVLLATGDDRLRSVALDHLSDQGYAVAVAAGGWSA